MRTQANFSGAFTFAGTSLTVNRMGYGAMQLAGQAGDKRVWGPPRDVPGAIAVLREAVASGVNHIDTSDYYGPHVTNQIIKQALHPYPDDLVIVTKVGARRGADGSWQHARSRREIIDAVHDNLRNLGLDAIQVVNLRLGGFAAPEDAPFEEPLSALAELKEQGLVRHIGLSTVSPRQLAEAQTNSGDARIRKGGQLANHTHRPGHGGQSRRRTSRRKGARGEWPHRTGRVAQFRARLGRGHRDRIGRHPDAA